MALSLQDTNLAKQRFYNFDFKPKSRGFARWLFQYFSQYTRLAQLQVKEHDKLSNTDTVIADAACTLYGWILKKGTVTTSWSKLTNSATTCATDGTQDISIRTNPPVTNGEVSIFFPDGMAMSAGITLRGNTTATGAGSSGTDGASGVVILGA